VPLDGFVGREAELTELARLVRRTRLVTLLGPGGAGKTRLALALAERVRDSYPGGVWLVELGPLSDGELVRQTVAATVGVPERSGADLTGTLAAALSGPRMLLVLDNCEHVAEQGARLAEELLRRCPDLQVLTTSREALQVPGEVIFRVAELSLPPQGAGVSRAELLQSDAVRLFVERARASVPDFELTADNGAAVAGICARLDGIPLAIELAARRARMLPVPDILARLDDRFGFLTGGSRTAAGRHRDLRATIDWSYELLDPAEQAVLRRLSVLVGGFDLDAATAVCTGVGVPAGLVLDLVTSLESKSLLVPQTGGREAGRFRQLESIRLYGRERLAEAGELDAAYERLVGWLTDLAEPFAEATMAATPVMVNRLLPERDNLLHAVRWAARHGDDRQARLASALAWAWLESGQLAEGRKLLAEVLVDTTVGSRHRDTALVHAGRLAAMQGEYAEALRLGEEAALAERARRHAARLAKALQLLAFTHSSLGEIPAARAYTTECLELVRDGDPPTDTAVCQHYLACMAIAEGDLDAAETLMAQCLPTYRSHFDGRRLVGLLHTAGELALARADLDGAEERFRECLRTAHAQGREISLGLESLAVVAARRGEAERAVRLAGAAVTARPSGEAEREPAWQRQLDAAIGTARERLPERAAEAAFAAGEMLGVDAAMRYALDGVWRADGSGDASWSPLTPREQDVVRLVAQGHTNRQIGGKLRIAERTVESHLEHIRDKLDLRSRAQVAAWAAEQGSLGPS
jgi:predicted ATPase/DNA-binding CsgD family transcriptional regulator